MNKIKKLLSLVVLSQVLILPQWTHAQACSDFSGSEFNVGFFLNSNQKQILQSLQFKASNKGVSKEEKQKRVEKHIPKYRTQIPQISNEKLAQYIVNASEIVGVDFSILSSVVRKESVYCKVRHNKTGGDSGCMQFTTAGLTELKHQFGLAGPKHNAAGVPEVLKSFVAKYFKDQSGRESVFFHWLKSPVADQKVALRGTSIIDVDILAGAILLKVYLSTSNGNYITALRQYNSSAKKIAYANDANAVALNINYQSLQCIESAVQTDRIILDSCEVDNDTNCFLNEESFSQPINTAPANITQVLNFKSPLKYPMVMNQKLSKVSFVEK